MPTSDPSATTKFAHVQAEIDAAAARFDAEETSGDNVKQRSLAAKHEKGEKTARTLEAFLNEKHKNFCGWLDYLAQEKYAAQSTPHLIEFVDRIKKLNPIEFTMGVAYLLQSTTPEAWCDERLRGLNLKVDENDRTKFVRYMRLFWDASHEPL